MDKVVREWLIRADSSLSLAKKGEGPDVCYEDLCFQIQQSAEKALKAFLISRGIDPPRTHSFNQILGLIKEIEIVTPEILDVINLNDYAVQTRYPGDYTPITKEEYEEALEIGQNILKWVKGRVR